MPKSLSIELGRPLGASLLLLGLLCGALGAVWASWADLSAVSDERDAKADLLQRSVTASRRAQLAPASSPADPFVPAETGTLAAAAVDSDLRSLASETGLSLLSSRADAKPDEPGAADAGIGTRIEEQAVMEGQNEALQALLVRLETGTPAVLVDNLSIEPVEVDPAVPGDPVAPRLRVSVTLSAYWRPASPAPK
jgi:hypothetical protein